MSSIDQQIEKSTEEWNARKPVKFPLKDGQKIRLSFQYGEETVGGEIKPEHKEPICWTIQGNWYRRSDGEEMTSAGGKVMTFKEFCRLRRLGKL